MPSKQICSHFSHNPNTPSRWTFWNILTQFGMSSISFRHNTENCDKKWKCVISGGLGGLSCWRCHPDISGHCDLVTRWSPERSWVNTAVRHCVFSCSMENIDIFMHFRVNRLARLQSERCCILRNYQFSVCKSHTFIFLFLPNMKNRAP